jgi:hypothetical protein
VALRLPPVGVTGGALAVEALEVNGQPWPLDMPLPDSALPDGAEVVVTLGPGDPAPLAPLRIVQDTSDFRALFAPREPRLDAVERDGDRLRLRFDANGEAGVVFHIWRDGQQVAEALTDTTWRDPDSGDFLNNSYCYSVEAEFPTTGHRSHRSPPRCDWGEERIQDLSAYTFQATGGRWSTTHGRGHFEDWGDAGHAIEVYGFRPRWTGTYLIQPRYGNGSGPVNTGITAGVKVLSVRDLTDDREVARGQVMMPHLGAWDRWAEGSTLEVALDATRRYALRVEDGANMSSLSHFVSYTGGAGGGEGTWNRVNLSGLRLLPLRGQDSGRLRGDAVALGTADDLASFPPAQRIAPGAPRSPRSAAAITWDQDFLYVALSTESFDDPWRPLQLYLEASEGPLAPPSPSQGQEYSGLRPWLPFTPTHLVSLRPQPGAPGEAPWSAIWRPRGQAWSQLWRLEPGQSLWWSPAAGVIAARVPLAPLGDVRHLRLSAHVVHAQPGQEWKDTLPDTHTPWAASTSGYYELNLQGPTPSDQWSTR